MRIDESTRTGGGSTARRGSTLIELTIVTTLFVVVFLSSLALIESGNRFSSATLEITALEEMAEQTLFKIEKEVANAVAVAPRGTLTVNLPAAATGTLTMTSTTGFPPAGTLLIDAGQPNEERIAYSQLNGNGVDLDFLTRGEQCTAPQDHGNGATVLWVGVASPIEDQSAPPVDTYDGEVEEAGTKVYYRGDGSGFAYRVPIDPTGGTTYLDAAGQLRLGAEIRGIGSTTSGVCAFYFAPVETYEEARTGDDVNHDGDKTDVFDIGQIRRIRWDTANPALTTDDVAWGPSAILQERCNWGGDLDDDESDDPIFLWDEATGQLHTRLYVLGHGREDIPIVRKVESVTFLRNAPEL